MGVSSSWIGVSVFGATALTCMFVSYQVMRACMKMRRNARAFRRNGDTFSVQPEVHFDVDLYSYGAAVFHGGLELPLANCGQCFFVQAHTE
jgi:hypothetical protein